MDQVRHLKDGDHFTIREQKTGQLRNVTVNKNVLEALQALLAAMPDASVWVSSIMVMLEVVGKVPLAEPVKTFYSIMTGMVGFAGWKILRHSRGSLPKRIVPSQCLKYAWYGSD